MIPKISSNIQKALRISFAAFAVLAMLFECIAFSTNLQADSNYFEHGAILPTLAIVFAVLAASIGTLEALLTSKSSLDAKGTIRFAFLPSAIGFAVSGFYHFSNANDNYDTIVSLILIIAALYALSQCVIKAKIAESTSFLGFAAMIGCAGLTGYHYFDSTVEMNAPAKVLLQMSMLVAMLFFTSELRRTLSTPIRKLYTTLATWTIATGAITAVPIILAYATGKIERTDYLVDAILVLTVTVTAALRMLSLYLEKEPIEDPIEDASQDSREIDTTEASTDTNSTSDDTTI